MGWARIPGTNQEQYTDANGKVLATQELDGKATADPPPQAASPAPVEQAAASASATTPAPTADPGLAGLKTLSGMGSPDAGAPTTLAGAGGGLDLSGFMTPGQAPGQVGGSVAALRASLGTRIPPQPSLALAGLRKAY